MKKYHIGDLLTLLEVILASILLVMAFLGVPADYAIWVFSAAELCDAFDGPCARRWHYPNDGKKRWWREHHILIDQLSDIYLAITCGFYLIWRVSASFGCILLFGIGIYCLIIQLYISKFDLAQHRFIPRSTVSANERHSLVMIRRFIYAILGIGGAVILLIFSTSWPFQVKVAVTIFGISVIFPALLIFKKPRTRNEITPL